MYTLEQAILDVQTQLLDIQSVLFPVPILRDWLTQGQDLVAALTLCDQHRVVFTSADAPPLCRPGVREYEMAFPVGGDGLGLSNVIRVLEIMLNGEMMPLWTGEQVSRTDARSAQGGTPHFWYQFGTRIGFVPFPDAAFVTAPWTMEVIYAALPAPWTSGPSLLPPGFYGIAVDWAVLCGLLVRRSWAQAGSMFTQWIAGVMEARHISLVRRSTDRLALNQAVRHERLDLPRLRLISAQAATR